MTTIDDPERELRRVVDRCAALPLARWSRAGDDGRTPEQLVHATAQKLADLAAQASGDQRRVVPALRPHGLADQLTVLARDALAVCEPEPVATVLATLRRRL